MTMANVDGTGRQIKLVYGTCGNVKVEAGCFCGTVDEFCVKAEGEGKTMYSAVVKAVASTMKANQ